MKKKKATKAKPSALLKPYEGKRNFSKSPEPTAKAKAKKTPKKVKAKRFVIHKHAASRLHYDLRLECEGVLRSWAVPRGPSLDPLVQRLSVRVEDHPLSYCSFEAVIPKGNYGAGTMMVWDEGTYTLYEAFSDETPDETFQRQYRKGNLKLELEGKKVRGKFALVKMKTATGDDWLLFKKRDAFASRDDVLLQDCSVKTGRSMEEIAAGMKEKEPAVQKEGDPEGKGSVGRGGLEGRERPLQKNEKRVLLVNPTKIFWPEERYTKKDLYDYYQAISPLMLPHLKDRPQSLHRHPNGILGKAFFQKEVAGSVPRWIQTTNISAYGGQKTVTQILCQDKETLLFLINMGCIEINPWLSRVPEVTVPDFAVIDIDPGTLGFAEVIEGAKVVEKLLEEVEAISFCKTSGSRGVHIYLPTDRKAEFSDCQKFAELVGEYLLKKLPKLISTQRNPMLRRNKLYIDALQNRKGQTMASIYSVRPKAGAPVSTPILWKEVTKKLDPGKFTIKTLLKRVDKFGDLWEGIFKEKNSIAILKERIITLL